jgi:dTDP-4-dehydrorhamnose reductase
MGNILITGACGQLGTELTAALRNIYDKNRVLATDLSKHPGNFSEGPFEQLDVMDESRLHQLIKQYDISHIYHLAAMLSANA